MSSSGWRASPRWRSLITLHPHNAKNTTNLMTPLPKQCSVPKKRRSDCNSKLSIIVHRIRYFKLLLTKARGGGISLNILQRVRKKANTTHMSDSVPEILNLFKQDWYELSTYMNEAAKKRDEFLSQLINPRDNLTEETRRTALTNIRIREKAKRRYYKIRGVLNRLKSGGLTHLDIPI